jgi:hypothetical protein
VRKSSPPRTVDQGVVAAGGVLAVRRRRPEDLHSRRQRAEGRLLRGRRLSAIRSPRNRTVVVAATAIGAL